MKPLLIFVASTHGFIDDFLKQEEIIESARPEFVLCEELEDLELDSEGKFNELLQKKKISNMTSFEEVSKLVEFCFNKGIKLIGIDFKNFGFNFALQNKVKNQEELTKKEEKELNKIMKLREKRHLHKILEYRKKTSRPLVIILGCWHLRKGSLLRTRLKNYQLIAPVDKNNKPVFAPIDKEGIKYVNISSNG